MKAVRVSGIPLAVLSASLALIFLCHCPCPRKPCVLAPVCVDFEDQEVDAVFNVGEVLSASNVEFGVEEFFYGGGGSTTDGKAVIDDRGYSRGGGKDLNTRNVNLRPYFSHNVKSVDLYFAELGGNVNLSINGDFKNTANLHDLNNTVVGGVQVTVEDIQEGNNYYGRLKAVGTISEFSIGGQELWIDNFCFEPTFD